MSRAPVTFVVAVAVVALAACSGSGGPTSSSTPTPPTAGSPTGAPAPGPLDPPVASGEGFCTDRGLVTAAIYQIAIGTAPYRRVAAYVGGVARIIQTDAAEVPRAERARFKVRQLGYLVATLRLAVLGAAENYPGDFAVRSIVRALPDRVERVSATAGC